MGRRRTAAAAVAGVIGVASGLGLPAAGSAQPASTTRYSLAGGCYALRSQALGRLVVKSAGGSYRAAAAAVGEAEPFRMQATTLGRYLFFGPLGDFLGHDESRVRTIAKPGPAGDWTVEDSASGGFTARPTFVGGKELAAGPGGSLVLADATSAGDASRFTFEPASGCADFPEAEVDAVGTPSRGKTPYGEIRGLLDAHVHGMAFEYFGGDAHCGRPWSPWGITVALGPCKDQTPARLVGENFLSGNYTQLPDTVGWPTFKDWPGADVLFHEGFYYKWLERAWRGGLRIYDNLLVENHTLCTIWPSHRHGCNEMDSIRLQAKDMYALQDYIDAQNGGPGKGWFRIVTDPFQARRVINAGKLAVVLGIETSQPLDCTLHNDIPGCDRATIDRELDEVYRLGVRHMLLVNKFDNALGGVAGDGGAAGFVFTNQGNKLETGKYWQLQTCQGPAEESDNEQLTLPGTARDVVVGNVLAHLLPAGTLPLYPAPPHCNARGLTDLGEYLLRRMMGKGMIIDPDHLDVVSRKQLLALLEASHYSGVISSHSWSTSDAYPRIYHLGGVVTPYAGDSKGFVEEWRKLRREADPRYYWGFGYGSDIQGLGAQGGPRNGPHPVQYPFKSFDGAVTLSRQRTGQRVFDINKEGVAHYGLYPDWIEDLRKIAGRQIIDDMARGPEAYLEMWERAVGVSVQRCRAGRARLTSSGLGTILLGDTPEQVLRRAGQPGDRPGRSYEYCVGTGDANVTAAFTPAGKVGLIASTAPGHKADGIAPGAATSRLRGRAAPVGRGLWRARGSNVVFGVRGGKVRYVAVALPSVVTKRATLRRYLRFAGV